MHASSSGCMPRMHFHWFDHPGPMQIVLSFSLKVVLHASGVPKSPGLCTSCHHHQRNPPNEASLCATPTDDYLHVPNIDNDNDDCPCPATATKMAPSIPIPTNPALPASTLAPITAAHNFCTPQECVEEEEGGGICALLRRPGNIWGRGAVEGEGAGSTLEGGRRRGGGRDEDRDGDDDQALWGIEGRFEGATIAPITIPVR
ncbi:hypothetical protein EV421DRAFT_1741720 [Armillaria borealis]|uniref:Uncharacterized protein n=1 Tax=Armillaria borealis TaxID=47425 RepID=A0AA39J0J7_9AGAR|nr:hypothetical protein EV421DRAFT_1741720 [Armillaria borealis]